MYLYVSVFTCGSISIAHSDKSTDGSLPALFGRDVKHTLDLSIKEQTYMTAGNQFLYVCFF